MGRKLPPGQEWVDGLIPYDIGPVPPLQLEDFRLRIDGEVENPFELTWEELLQFPQAKAEADFHCVTRWSVPGLRWEGVSARAIIDLCRPKEEVRWVLAYGRDGYSTNVPYKYFAQEDTILAHKLNGEPLPPENGWPLRLVVPSLYAWKSAKYLVRLEFTREKRRGYWEERGYHDVGDPWREERRWDSRA